MILTKTDKRAEQLISVVKNQAALFEMRTRYEPTIFMSYDLFSLLKDSDQTLVHRLDETQVTHTICGYEIELLRYGSNLLYVGYKVSLE